MRTYLLLPFIGILFCSFFVQAQQSRRGDNFSDINAKRKITKQKNNSFYIDQTADIENFVKHKLFGNCAVVSNIQLNTNPVNKDSSNAVGVFVDSSATIGLTSGLLLTTGSAYLAQGPNDSQSATNVNSLPGDSLVGTLIPGFTTYDATILEFDFVPLADSILAFEFVFASEEYPEFVGSSFNDVFGFFISGPGINGVQNIALIPGTNIPIAINNINDTTNEQYYIDNTNRTILQYDAYTTVFQIVQQVIPFETYHYKVVIADAGDQAFDSGVFLGAESFTGLIDSVIVDFNYSIDSTLKSVYTVHFTNNTTGASEYLWDFGDGTTSNMENPSHTYTSAGNYNVTLTAQNYCYTENFSSTINLETTGINTLNNNYTDIVPVEDGIFRVISNSNIVAVSVFNAIGQKLESFESGLINLTKYPKGIYTVRIEDQGNVSTRKIIR